VSIAVPLLHLHASVTQTDTNLSLLFPLFSITLHDITFYHEFVVFCHLLTLVVTISNLDAPLSQSGGLDRTAVAQGPYRTEVQQIIILFLLVCSGSTVNFTSIPFSPCDKDNMT
jgi:hypothetical protein